MFAFSTCWNSERHIDGRAMVNEVRALGFEYVELGHGTRVSLLTGVQEAVAAGEIKICSVHNFCPTPIGVMGPAPNYYLPSSRDEDERRYAVRHTLRTIDCAAALGAKVVVMHLGKVPMRHYTGRLLNFHMQGRAESPRYHRLATKAITIRDRKRQKPLDQVYRTLDEVLPRAKELRVKIGMETRLGVEEIPNEREADQILIRFGTDTIMYWHDIGHAAVKEVLGLMSIDGILTRFRGRTAGMHLQDFHPPAEDHLPAGFGTFDFSRLTRFVTEDMVLAWEIHPHWKAAEITEGLKRVHDLLRKPVTA
ncbi:MAG TPA: sugar phosphate isomerase/epimerase [Verrucomicrobiae bacterium]|nr:sugar phosphate isomerase/epimerase [Verrucomicrobiae bacterium]